jgi:REP element-mobilizing transposase RayT
MPYRKVELRAGCYYHLYNRGANRQPIFLCEENWGFFIRQLRDYFRPELVDVLAYCLMPNHYHLLVHAKTDLLSKEVMQPFSVSYVKALNKQQQRSGPLFEGPFQARLVERDEYLRHLSRYIHLNPVIAGLAKEPEGWPYSSYRDYVGLRQGTLPRPAFILSQFPSPAAYREFVISAAAHKAGLPGELLFQED